MSTSGTIGSTVISTDKLIDHAVRRCGLSPSILNAENIEIARDNLYLVILAILNDGINLWLIQHSTISLEQFKALYVLPNGTVDLLNVQYSTPTIETGTDSSTATSFTTELSGSTTLQAIGVEFSAIAASNTIFFEQSVDGVVWTSVTSDTKTDWETGLTYWYRLSTLPVNTFFRVRCANNITVSRFLLATNVYDIPIYPYNRDDYLAQSNKSVTGRPSTNYYYEKLIDPQITLWPVPNNSDDFLSIATQRQVQDIGLLNQEIEVPERWKEVIIWQLSNRLSFEIPGVDPNRRQEISVQLDMHMRLVDVGETDGTTINIYPAIGSYTK